MISAIFTIMLLLVMRMVIIIYKNKIYHILYRKMGFFENQLHNQFNIKKNSSESVNNTLKFLSTIHNLLNKNDDIMTLSTQILNFSLDIK